jgi:hypothetical protein
MKQKVCIKIFGLFFLLFVFVTNTYSQNYSLRFYGNGVNDIDRVKIRLDAPQRPIDVGLDFTLEWWMKANAGDNGTTNCIEGGDGWIYGNIIFDRDIYGAGDFGDFGVSIANGRVSFGVSNGSNGQTICSTQSVTNGFWHHIAVTRNSSNGQMRIFIDGQLNRTGTGATGDISYRDGRSTPFPNDPFLVIGAEKHDAGSSYPSYRGWVDEVRVSNIVRYNANFTPPTQAFTTDANTVALYHFNEGSGTTANDSSGAGGGPSNGVLNIGGTPTGPIWSSDSPFVPTATRAVITGHVTLENGKPLQGVMLTLQSISTFEIQIVISDEEGNFAFAPTLTGLEYVLTPWRKGFEFNPPNYFFTLNGENTNFKFRVTPSGVIRLGKLTPEGVTLNITNDLAFTHREIKLSCKHIK